MFPTFESICTFFVRLIIFFITSSTIYCAELTTNIRIENVEKTIIKENQNQPLLQNASDLQYLYDIYSNSLKIKRYNMTNDDLKMVEKSNVILTYKISNCNEQSNLCFNLSKTSNDDEFIGAKLFFYQKLRSKTSKILLHQLINTESMKKQLKFVDSFDVNDNFKGWIKMNVTNVVLDWWNYGNGKQFELVVSGKKDDKYVSLTFDSSYREEEPFVVAYFIRSENSVQSGNIRLKRDSVNSLKDISNGIPEAQSTKCQLKDLYVSFHDLKIDSNVVAPTNYNIQYCAGSCLFPLNKHANATNHAIIQALMHHKRPNIVPSVSCVPDRLDDLAVLYSRDEGNIYLKYPNVIAKSCGCN